MGNRIQLLIDMDGVMCDFHGEVRRKRDLNPFREFPQSEYGFWENLPALPGAIESYKKLETMFDVSICTKASEFNLNSYSGKAWWVLKNLGFKAQQDMFICGNKARVTGHILVDDELNANQANFNGRLIRFGTTEAPNWAVVCKQLMEIYFKTHTVTEAGPADFEERVRRAL